MIDTLSNGIGIVADHMVTPGIGIPGLNGDFLDDAKVEGLKYDVEAAKKELELGLKN